MLELLSLPILVFAVLGIVLCCAIYQDQVNRKLDKKAGKPQTTPSLMKQVMAATQSFSSSLLKKKGA